MDEDVLSDSTDCAGDGILSGSDLPNGKSSLPILRLMLGLVCNLGNALPPPRELWTGVEGDEGVGDETKDSAVGLDEGTMRTDFVGRGLRCAPCSGWLCVYKWELGAGLLTGWRVVTSAGFKTACRTS